MHGGFPQPVASSKLKLSSFREESKNFKKKRIRNQNIDFSECHTFLVGFTQPVLLIETKISDLGG